MASNEKQIKRPGLMKNPNTIGFSNEPSWGFNDPFLEMEDISLSPNGPLSDMNCGSNGSSYSSPLGSEMGSTETEREGEVSLAELTRRMAEFTFQDDEEDDGLSHKTTQNLEAYQLRNDAQMEKTGRKAKGVEHKEQNKGKGWRSKGEGKRGNLAGALSAQGGSGMRAVFLGGSNGRNGSGGTGVFLPSVVYNKEEPKRKPGCSTVLIPARVLHTLQQHFKNVSAQSPSHPTSGCSTHPSWQDDILARINGLLSQQKEHAEIQTNVPATTHDLEELRLPQEWTY